MIYYVLFQFTLILFCQISSVYVIHFYSALVFKGIVGLLY